LAPHLYSGGKGAEEDMYRRRGLVVGLLAVAIVIELFITIGRRKVVVVVVVEVVVVVVETVVHMEQQQSNLQQCSFPIFLPSSSVLFELM